MTFIFRSLWQILLKQKVRERLQFQEKMKFIFRSSWQILLKTKRQRKVYIFQRRLGLYFDHPGIFCQNKKQKTKNTKEGKKSADFPFSPQEGTKLCVIMSNLPCIKYALIFYGSGSQYFFYPVLSSHHVSEYPPALLQNCQTQKKVHCRQ